MNFLAISLILTSLVTAGIWSPTPENKQSKDQDVIVKDGHRVVVVEYERQGQPNTKVSISPDQEPHNFDSPSGVSGTFGAAKIKEASSVLPNIGQGLSGSNGQVPNPKELICDAYGKCKHKIADAMGKTKDVVSETARDVKEVAYSKIQKKKDIASDVGEAIEDAYVGAKDTVSHATHEVGERAKESLKKGKSTMKTTKDTGKTIGKDISSNASDFVEAAGKKASEVKDGAFRYLDTPETLKSLMGVLHLMGFATAYGMCIWVTFISSHVLAGNLPRQQFGILQSKIYPVYFRAMTWVIGLALFGHLLGHRKRLFESRAYMFHVYTLLAPLLMVLANMLYLEPRATKVKDLMNFYINFYDSIIR